MKLFVEGMDSNKEAYVCLNVDQIACMRYYKDCDKTEVHTVIKGMPIWFDGNLISRLEYLAGLYDPDGTKFMEVK